MLFVSVCPIGSRKSTRQHLFQISIPDLGAALRFESDSEPDFAHRHLAESPHTDHYTPKMRLLVNEECISDEEPLSYGQSPYRMSHFYCSS